MTQVTSERRWSGQSLEREVSGQDQGLVDWPGMPFFPFFSLSFMLRFLGHLPDLLCLGVFFSQHTVKCTDVKFNDFSEVIHLHPNEDTSPSFLPPAAITFRPLSLEPKFPSLDLSLDLT